MKQEMFDFAQNNSATPMMKQYLTIKSAHQDCILFYRMGDFYEMFFEDAIIAAKALGIALTKRGKNDGADIPMCGVPYHSSDMYLQKLISLGHKVAICEQIEAVAEAKKRGYKAVVKREVVRIITPGTITEENLLNSKCANYLMSIIINDSKVSIAYSDISTGEIATIITDIGSLNIELARLNPSEIIISDEVYNDQALLACIGEYKKVISSQVSSFFEYNKALRKFKSHYNVLEIESFGEFSPDQISAIGALLEYLSLTQKKSEIRLQFPKNYLTQNFMIIDRATRKNLELTENINHKTNSSLLSVIDRTKTNMGARLLNNHLSSPLLDINIINNRLDLVELFYQAPDLIEELQKHLSLIADTERTVSRLALGRGNARDLVALKKDLITYENIKQFLYHNLTSIHPNLEIYLANLDKFSNLITSIEEAIIDEPPLLIREGGFIRKGLDKDLDELFDINQHSNKKIQELKQQYISETGISNLKITKNNILGYFIEVTPQNLNKIDKDRFILRQAMVNCSRFTTHELRILEENILGASDKIINSELDIFNRLIGEITQFHQEISEAAWSVAAIDVAISLASLALEKSYTRPILSNDKVFILKNCRHPVVEEFLAENNEEFTGNDIDFNEESNIALLTGPNMAGKSTYLRQNAICSILAQMGSFVPASSSSIGLVDRVFSRVGASDDLAGGKSTFMVEMVETATILNQATDKSLVILDEIGRGTSTYDGLAIARSVLEYIANNINCRTLFATHYHELVELENELANLKNYTMDVKEWNSKIIFLHKIIAGSADRSYGIHVAELAGLPKAVITRANQILLTLEQSNQPACIAVKKDQVEHSELSKLITSINIDDLSPKQALDILYKLKITVG